MKALICCSLISTASCVNEISSEVSSGTTPIKFATSIGKVSTRISGNRFDVGEQIGLFAMVSGKSITDDKRYIDNLTLVCGNNNEFIPEKTVFYPEGDETLDFISYFPYQTEGVVKKSSKLSVSVQADQSNHINHSNSDFLVAEKSSVSNSSNAVQLKFQHKFACLRIELVPQDGEDINDMLDSNIKITANGLFTKADYDFNEKTLTNHSHIKDIIPFGKWKIEDNKLTGKELVVIPQETASASMNLSIDWNGKVYTCLVSLSSLSSNKLCVITIKASQKTDNQFQGIIGEIDDWGELTQEESTNNGDMKSIPITTLSFNQSDIYQVHMGGDVVAEVCKEYLLSDNIDAQAIVVYPVLNNQAQFNNGTVLKLLNVSEEVHGGTVSWNSADNTLIYTAGTSAAIDVIYIDSDGSIAMEEPISPVTVNIESYLLRDIRSGVLATYPVVKIGTQYWMKENLKASTYRNGTSLKVITAFDNEAGYFYVSSQDSYYYTGDAVKANELAPKYWKIPNYEEWDKMLKYIDYKSLLLQNGQWGDGENEYTGSDETGFNAIAYGLHNNKNATKPHVLPGSTACYWISSELEADVEDSVIRLLYSESEVMYQKCIPQNYALFVRCIKE